MSELFVDIGGNGPPLVLLHGWAMHGGVFAGLSERLHQRHTVYAVDLPGHGHSRGSTTPWQLGAVADAIYAQVPPRAAWCGWSLGGLIALHAAATRPDAVAHLTLLCATPCFVRLPDWPHAVSGEIFQEFAQGLRTDYLGTLDRFIALEAFGSEHARVEIRALRAALSARGRPTEHALMQGLNLLRSVDLRAYLPHLPMPSLWLAGRRDRLVPPQAMAAAAALAPRATYCAIHQAGHAPFLTHAEIVMRHWQADASQGLG